MTATKQGPALTPIAPEVLYPLQDFAERSGLGKAALRTARSKGLRVKYVGGRGFIFGRDFLRFVEKSGRDHK